MSAEDWEDKEVANLDFVEVKGADRVIEDGPFEFTDEDWLLYAMLTDPVYMPELLWKDPQNRDYGGCYRVRDYQYQLNRCDENYAIFACSRAIGKTESEKIHAEIHGFDGNTEGQSMLITAPELIHLLPLADAIEDHIRDCRLLREMLDLSGGQTGFTHRPFGVNWLDGTKLIGRIPRLMGTGLKGMHAPRLIMEEAQDYPEKGWIEINETVNYDSTGPDGKPNFRFWIYGVHGGNKASGFDERARSTVWRKTHVTTLMRYDWGKERKENAVASYGGSSSPDYRRNILGEPGAGASQYFVTARVMACTDQRIERPPDAKGSDYNVNEYVKETFRFEEMESLGMNIADSLDLPAGENYHGIWGGVDIGLTESPTVISLFAEGEWEKKQRLALIRKFTLERFRPKEIRQALFTIGWHFGAKLLGVGIDITGIGLPLYQDMGDDELAPQHLLDVTVGYTFNSTIPVEVDPKMCTEANGVIRDQYGAMVKREEDEITGEVRYIAMMPFIAASTRELRTYVDSTRLLLPFDTDVISDMLGETKQRVERIGSRAGQGAVKKGDRFHILDSFRAMAMRTRADDITAKLAQPQQLPVLDRADDRAD